MGPRTPIAVTWALGLLGGWLLLYESNVRFAFGPETGVVFGRPAHLVLSFAAAAICLLGAARRARGARAPWVLVALAIFAWSAGDVYWTVVLLDEPTIPVPSLADAGYLAFPVLLYAAIALLMRPAANATSRLLLVDGVAAGLALGALAVATILDDLLSGAGGVALSLTYAVSDLVLLGLVVGAVAVRGWRLDRMWALMGGGIVAFWIADTHYAVAIANGSYSFPGDADAGWTGCFLLLAAAAWQPASAVRPVARLGVRVTLLPLGFAALALAVLAHAGFGDGSKGAVALAVASLLAVGIRAAATLVTHVGLLDGSRMEATTDALTGLGNRRRLMTDLDAALAAATPRRPWVLVLFDLDGFKHYNDTFGHPAGDALLTLLGQRLAAGVGPGARAYRMGGDEFCVLAGPEAGGVEALCAAGAAAVEETGGSFDVGASFGAVRVPHDATSPEQALRLVDQRMYAHKHSSRLSAGRQAADVLIAALVERDGELGTHVRDVAELAGAVARELGLDPERCTVVGQAAALHDVGKVAVPEAILDKPGPLDAEEWAIMRQHTIVGERIVGAAPVLRGVAAVVRSTHERWDGGGYPDALAGEAIPLPARIVAVCDAYHAMRTPRPYCASRSEEEALDELRMCSGGQFDPAVIEAFCRVAGVTAGPPVAA